MAETQIEKIAAATNMFKPRLAKMVSEKIGLDRFLYCFLNLVSRTPQLAQCTQRSLFGSLFTCAQLGLIADGFSNRAHLVPLRNKKKPGKPLEANFWLGYMGAKELAERHPDVKRIELPTIVYEGDDYHFMLGTAPQLTHHQCPYSERGEMVAVYAVAVYSDGTKTFRWLWKGEVDEHRSRSPSKDGPWYTDYHAMAMKTAIIDVSKYLPQCLELSRAVLLEDESHRGESQTFIDLPPEFDDLPEPQSPPQLTDEQLAASMTTGVPPGSPLGVPGDTPPGAASAATGQDLPLPGVTPPSAPAPVHPDATELGRLRSKLLTLYSRATAAVSAAAANTALAEGGLSGMDEIAETGDVQLLKGAISALEHRLRKAKK